MWVDAERSPALKDIAAKFKADTGIEVKLVIKDFAAVRDDFITQVPTGKGPDLIVGPHDWLGKFVQNGVVAPVELGDKAADFPESAIKAMTYDGQTYGVPYSIENIALLRNTDLAPEPPATLDEVIADGKERRGRRQGQVPVPGRAGSQAGRPVPPVPAADLHGFGRSSAGRRRQLRRLASSILGNAGGVEFAEKLVDLGRYGRQGPELQHHR